MRGVVTFSACELDWHLALRSGVAQGVLTPMSANAFAPLPKGTDQYYVFVFVLKRSIDVYE